MNTMKIAGKMSIYDKSLSTIIRVGMEVVNPVAKTISINIPGIDSTRWSKSFGINR